MRRIFTFGLAIMALCCIFAVSATATPEVPYAHYDAWFQSDTEGAAGIYRCSCNPVSNYLSATACVQYEDVYGQYKWTSERSYGAPNIAQSAFVVTAPAETYANYVMASFAARCGNGPIITLSDSDYR